MSASAVPAAETSAGSEGYTESQSLWLMIGISAGHGVKHFGQGALLVMMPFIRSAFGMSDIVYGSIFTINSVSSGIANVPAGMLADMYRKRIAWLLAVSMLMVGTGYLLVGVSPWLWLIGIAVAIIGFGTSLWHAPAFGTLAARYPSRRGVAMAAHLTGAQIGNTTSPVIIGLLLGGTIGAWHFAGFEWRYVSAALFIPMALTSLLVLTRFKTAGAEAERNLDLTEYLHSARRLLTNLRVLGMAVLGAFRGAVHTSFQAFVVVYMKETLEMSSFTIGWHVSLLTLAGIASTPVMGWLSDRIGRKPVIFGAMSAMAVFVFSVLAFSEGIAFTIILAVLGLFFFSVMPIITAAAMDQVDRGAEGSATALMFTGGSVIGALSPVLAGWIFQNWDFDGVIIYCGVIATIGAFLALIFPMRKAINA